MGTRADGGQRAETALLGEVIPHSSTRIGGQKILPCDVGLPENQAQRGAFDFWVVRHSKGRARAIGVLSLRRVAPRLGYSYFSAYGAEPKGNVLTLVHELETQ